MSSAVTNRAHDSVIQQARVLPFRRGADTKPLLMSAFLALSDLCALSIAISAGFVVWRVVNPQIPPLGSAMLLVPVCCVLEFAFSGHYPGIGFMAVEHLRRMWRGITLVYLLSTTIMFLGRGFWVPSPRGALALAWALSLCITPLGRWLANELLSSRSWWGVRAILIGAGSSGREVIRNLAANKILGYRVIACLDDDARNQGACCEGIPVVGSLADARSVAIRYNLRYAIIALPEMPNRDLIRHFHTWRHIFQKIVLVPDLPAISTLWTQPRDLGGLLALEVQHNLLKQWNQWVKRAVDVVGAATGLILTGPILALCALWIKAVNRGNAFYTQSREGREGRTIRVLKLRTMYPNAECTLEQYLAANPAAREEWERYCKLKRDPRILPGIGHLLRTTSLDELPQLWNVLKGEMSLVGPRPFPGYHNARFDQEFRELRTQVIPGLTGLWQVLARSNGDLEVQKFLDSYYLRNWSLWLDLYILIRTLRVVLTQEGSC